MTCRAQELLVPFSSFPSYVSLINFSKHSCMRNNSVTVGKSSCNFIEICVRSEQQGYDGGKNGYKNDYSLFLSFQVMPLLIKRFQTFLFN